jgi:hypothetical protein
MQIRKIWFTCLAGLVSVVGAAVAHAEQPSYTELAERLAQLEAQMEAQSVGLVSYQHCDTAAGSSCSDCDYGPAQGGHCACSTGCGCAPITCRTPAWYAGYELTFLQAHISSNNITFPFGWDEEYGAGNRFVLGYDHGNGIGGRLRYWMFNHGLDAEVLPGGIGIDMDVADAEVTLQNRLAKWNLLLSGGVRYARTEFSTFGLETYFEGVGPTVSLETTRQIGRRGFYLLGNLRTSVLLGEIGNDFFLDSEGESTFVLENQLGMGWSREIGMGELNIRSTWETQYWFNSSLGEGPAGPILGTGISNSLALSGPTFAIELRY